MTRVAKKGIDNKTGVAILDPTFKRPDGTTIYVPEPIFSFTTVFGVQQIDKYGQPKIIWTLAKDRQEANLWTPVAGGEDDWPIKEQSFPYGIFDFGQNTGLREAIEESGVKIKLWGTGPFWICGMPYGYPNYTVIIKQTDQEPHTIQGVHTVLYYYMGEVIGKPQLCQQKGAEHQFRNVDMKILSIQESFETFAKGEMNAYPTIKEAFCRFAWLMRCAENPFLQEYPEDWVEKEGLMERTWKNSFITL